MTLDELIRQVADRGDLPALTLWRTERGYQANLSRGSVTTWRVEIHADPVEALRRVLSEKTPDKAEQTDRGIFG